MTFSQGHVANDGSVVDPLPSPPPRISVVIPAYNREKYVGLTLESVLAQTFTDWAIVVVDDGSLDSTAAVVQGYADKDQRIRVVRTANGGVARARNRGIAESDRRAEFIIFLDSDDIWEPDTLETLVSELEAHPNYVSVHGLARCIDESGGPVPGDDLEERMRDRLAYRGAELIPMDPDEPVDFGALMYHNYVITPGICLMRRSVLDDVGEFDADTDPADDWDFAVRISRFGVIGYVEHVVLYWRQHDDTLTQSSPRWKSAYYAVRRKALTDPTNTPEQARLARLGYMAATRRDLRTARSLLSKRNVTGAARHCVRALECTGRYLRITLPMRLHVGT